MPQLLARSRVYGVEIALQRGAEYEIARRRENTGPRRRDHAMFPLQFARFRDDRAQMSPTLLRPEARTAPAAEEYLVRTELHVVGLGIAPPLLPYVHVE